MASNVITASMILVISREHDEEAVNTLEAVITIEAVLKNQVHPG